MSSQRSLFKTLGFLLLLRLSTATCDYKDTVPLELLENGSYLYEIGNITVPRNQTEMFGETVRGCFCKIRPCISVCCPPDQEFSKQTCINPQFKIPSEIPITIITKEGTNDSVNLNQQFDVQYQRPSDIMFTLIQYRYSIFENGSLSYNDGIEDIALTKDEYCLSPFLIEETYNYTYIPWTKYVANPTDTNQIQLNAKIMLFSVPFMLLTILLYVCPERKPLSVCFYLATLSVAFTSLAIINLWDQIGEYKYACTPLGYITYFAFMASYSWLTVKSYDLYKHAEHPFGSWNYWREFKIYSVFAWCFPTMMTAITYSAQKYNWPYNPQIGKDYCFIPPKSESLLFYFYLPGAVLISINIVFFCMTMIQKRLNDLENVLAERKKPTILRKLRSYLKRCGPYARIFLVTGIAWMFEFLTCINKGMPFLEWLLYIIAFQGYLIFILEIFRKDCRENIKYRYCKIIGRKQRPVIATKRTQCSLPSTQNTLI